LAHRDEPLSATYGLYPNRTKEVKLFLGARFGAVVALQWADFGAAQAAWYSFLLSL
jgi:hypothetical protein